METNGQVSIDTVDLQDSSAASALRDAFVRTGFVQIRGHGVDEEIRSDFRAACDAFFDLPLSQWETPMTSEERAFHRAAGPLRPNGCL